MIERLRAWLGYPTLEQEAFAFFSAGGRLTWADWTWASERQKQAWVAAAEQAQAGELFKLVTAFSGPEGLADVVSVVDKGKVLDRLLLTRALERI